MQKLQAAWRLRWTVVGARLKANAGETFDRLDDRWRADRGELVNLRGRIASLDFFVSLALAVVVSLLRPAGR